MSLNTHRPRGFTLLELLVVVMIVVILFSILLPILMRAMGSGEAARIRMDLQTISMALEAFKADHGDYPRDPAALTGKPAEKYRGATLLVQSLIAPAPDDGVTGPGFRKQGATQGRIFGPYLKPDAFKIAEPGGTAIVDDGTAAVFESAVLLDKTAKPILYFPGRSTKPMLSQAGMYVDRVVPGSGAKPLYNQYDNEILDLEDMRRLLGDTNNDGAISGAEKAATTGPFLLWTAGPDGVFGTDDDITNFNE